MSVPVSASLLKQLLVRSFVVCFIKILLVFCLSLYIFILILSIFVVIHPSNKTEAIWGSAENVAIKRQLKTFIGYIPREQINARPSHGNVNFNSLRKGFKNKPKIKGRTVRSLADPASVRFLKTTRHVSGLLCACMHFLHHTGMLLMRWWMLSWGISSQNWIRTSVNSYARWQWWMQRCPRFTWMESDLGDGWASH